MSKQTENKPKSWKESIKDWGGGDFTFLSEDGETITFIVVGLPQKLEGAYKGKENVRVGCPVVTDEGYQLFITGKRLARKLSKYEDKFGTNALMVTRQGASGDINAKYLVTVVPEKETYERLVAIKESDFEPDMIPASVAEAKKIVTN